MTRCQKCGKDCLSRNGSHSVMFARLARRRNEIHQAIRQFAVSSEGFNGLRAKWLDTGGSIRRRVPILPVREDEMRHQKWPGGGHILNPADVAEVVEPAFPALTEDAIERGVHVSVDFYLADPGRYKDEVCRWGLR